MLRALQCPNAVDAPAGAHDRRGQNADATTGETAIAPTGGGRSVSGPRFPIGPRGATTAYVASANPDSAARRVHPGRHVPAVRDPSASADDESSHGSASELPPAASHGYAEWDFSGVPDPVMFQRFLDATDYWFGYSEDSSAGSYDTAQECFVVLANDQANAANAAEANDGDVPPGPEAGPHQGAGPSAPPSSPPRGADINAQLAQARELEAKLAEKYRAVRLLRASIAGEASARGGRERELGRQARDRINIDFDVDNPNMPLRASQKLVAAATLLRAMPAPSTPEARNLHREAQALIEQAPFNRPKTRRHTSASRGARGTTGARKAPMHRYTRAARRNGPPTQGARRSGSGSLTRVDRPKTVTLATSSTPGGRATRRHGRRQPTTPAGGAL
jgi:hypothetical protein